MARAKKYTRQIIFALLGLVLLQFVALTGVLGELEDRREAQAQLQEQLQEQQAQLQKLEEASAEDRDAENEPPVVEDPPAVTEKVPPENALSAPEIMMNASVIAHGMGMIDGVTTLNSLESFRQQYERGVRVFEVDLRMTKDLQVVARHDWRAGWQNGVSETNVPTLDEFRAKPLLGKYTPLTFRDLLLLLEEYPDVCIITDTKFDDAEAVTVQFEAMLADARELGLSYLFDRIVVQVYSRLMFKVVDSIGQFPHYIYTLYTEGFNRTEEAFSEIAVFCAESGIMGVTMWDYWWRTEFEAIAREHGVSAYVHTVNDAQEAVRLLADGVSGIYTDSILPVDLTAAKDEMERGEEAPRIEEGE